MRSPFIAFVAAVLTLASAHSLAAAPEEETVTWYDVELIVFRHLETRSTESWPADAGTPDVEGALPLFPPVPEPTATATGGPGGTAPVTTEPLPSTNEPVMPGAPVPYQPLGDAAHQLTSVVNSLRRSSLYEPILHVAWTQPPLEREEAPKLRVTLPGALDRESQATVVEENIPGALVSDEREQHAEGGEPTVAAEVEPGVDELPEGADALLAEDDLPSFARPLDGTVQLSVGRYLHLALDLLYLPDDLNTAVLDDVTVATEEWTEAEREARDMRKRALVEALARGDITLEEAEILSLEPEEPVFEGFRLDQFRRLRSNEIHYFDHPVFGAIVKVTPREVPVRLLQDASQQPESGQQ